jgi:hypothetical protein
MFQIWHRKRKHEEILGGLAAGGMLVWERKKLPDAGAGQYAFETYGTPVYDFALGNGATFIRHPLVATQPALWANYTAPILSNPPSNIFQGQFATQPLMDPNTAVALGVTVQNAIPADNYNLIPPEGPAISLNP